MDHFPSDSEHLAASALLLLSSPCQFDIAEVKPQMIGAKSDQRGAAGSSHSNSTSSTTSSMITAGGLTGEIDRPRFRTSHAIVARYRREMRFKVSRRNRSKRYLICKIKHNDPVNMAETVKAPSESAQEAASESSCLSISGEPCHEETTINNKKEISSGHLWRRAEAILGFLKSGGCASEVRIRQVLGDTPDTSKALRILLKQQQIGRSGGGGRSDPYIYKLV